MDERMRIGVQTTDMKVLPSISEQNQVRYAADGPAREDVRHVCGKLFARVLLDVRWGHIRLDFERFLDEQPTTGLISYTRGLLAQEAHDVLAFHGLMHKRVADLGQACRITHTDDLERPLLHSVRDGGHASRSHDASAPKLCSRSQPGTINGREGMLIAIDAILLKAGLL